MERRRQEFVLQPSGEGLSMFQQSISGDKTKELNIDTESDLKITYLDRANILHILNLVKAFS